MAEKSKDSGKEHSSQSGSGMHFGVEVILFVVAIFILWVLAGGAKKPTTNEKPFIAQPSNEIKTGINN